MATYDPVPAVLRACLLAAAGMATLACAGARPRPSILLVSIDTLRADHLSCYGYRRPTSPSIDVFARDGVLFENAHSPSSWTLPGHASMLSGVSPFRHGATQETRAIRRDMKLLPEVLRASGYRTVGIINGPYVGAKYGFSRGFDTFVEALDKRDESYLGDVRSLIDGVPATPFFAFVHFMHVHSPYVPPAAHRFGASRGPTAGADGRRLLELDRRVRAGEVQLTEQDRDYLVALYDGEIRAVDEMVAQTIALARRKAHGLLLVVLTSDHGEEFLEHGGLLHGGTLFEESLHVPLIVVGPGIPARRVKNSASLLDVVPTILGIAGVSAPGGVEGRDLLAGDGNPSEGQPLPLQTSAHDGTAHLRGVRTASRKVIIDDRSGETLLYDLSRDRAERHSVPPGPNEALLQMLRGLRVAPSSELRAPEGSELEALRSLGYHQ